MPDATNRPDWTPELRARLAGVDADPARIDDIVLELEQHLEDRYDELIEDGLDADAARASALAELASPHVLSRALGMVERPAAPPPRVLGAPPRVGWLLGLWGDVRDGARALRASPGLTVVALLTLAVGIGANVAIFSVVNAVLLRPLPFADPDRLVGFWGSEPKRGLPVVAWADALYVRFRDRGRVLRPVAAYGEYQFTVTNGTGEAERIRGAAVTANFFETLGRSPIRGRAFTAAEEGPRREHVAILGYGLWQRRYGGDPTIVGQTIQAAEGPATIVGVMPPDFDFPNRAEVWIPLETNPTSTDCWCYRAIGRLAPGATPEEGAREMAWLTDGFWRERKGQPARDPKAKDPEAIVIAQPLARTLVGDVRGPLLILLCAVGTVLLIACANVANLLLARASARTREIALRACLGASPWRIARQLFVESLLLAIGGSMLGLALAAWSSRVLGRLAAERLPHVQGVPLDPSVLLFTVAVTVADRGALRRRSRRARRANRSARRRARRLAGDAQRGRPPSGRRVRGGAVRLIGGAAGRGGAAAAQPRRAPVRGSRLPAGGRARGPGVDTVAGHAAGPQSGARAGVLCAARRARGRAARRAARGPLVDGAVQRRRGGAGLRHQGARAGAGRDGSR